MKKWMHSEDDSLLRCPALDRFECSSSVTSHRWTPSSERFEVLVPLRISGSMIPTKSWIMSGGQVEQKRARNQSKLIPKGEDVPQDSVEMGGRFGVGTD